MDWIVKKLLLGVFFHENSPLAPLEWKFKNFDVCILFPLLRWMDQYAVCENQSNGWKVIQEGIFHGNFPVAPLKWNLESFWCSHVFALVELNLAVHCWWESVEQLKSYSTGCIGLKSRLVTFFQNSDLWNEFFCDFSDNILFYFWMIMFQLLLPGVQMLDNFCFTDFLCWNKILYISHSVLFSHVGTLTCCLKLFKPIE
jgi:hypothetical protein